jgi:hypothetical protein
MATGSLQVKRQFERLVEKGVNPMVFLTFRGGARSRKTGLCFRQVKHETGIFFRSGCSINVQYGAVETMEQKERIPQDLSDAFRQVVGHYSTWISSEPEITVRINNASYPMSVVCSVVVRFSDPLPEDVFDQLYGYMHAQHRELKEKLGRESTHSAGAYCLFRLIDERKADHAKRKSPR